MQVIDHAGAAGLTPAPRTQTTIGQQQQPNATVFVFRKAVKQNAKLRLALSGPGGSGKTYTLLRLATTLGGRIAAIDKPSSWISRPQGAQLHAPSRRVPRASRRRGRFALARSHR